ncbi:MAG TPA: VOC family protein [Burkholderiales bacterium]|nr:VOC family protein [Burkholderiales bacterium]
MSIAMQQVPAPGGLVLDHLAHFVPSLAEAAKALTALGFTVTPQSDHRTQDGPAGSSNVCVMLEHGYLEILAPTFDTPNAQQIRAAMARYAGVHLGCFGTPDAEGEQRRLEAHGFKPPPLTRLAREFEGRPVRFSVVRSNRDSMPEGRIQFCQHHTPEAIWRPQYWGHVNGAVKLACLFVVADETVDVAARWAHYAALLPRPAGGYVHLQMARGNVLVGARAQWAALLGDAPPAPGLAGYALECRDTSNLVSRCEMLGLPLRKLREDLYVAKLPEALGSTLMFGTREGLGLPS